MNKFFNDLQQEAQTIRLSTEEKQSMRAHIQSVMQTPIVQVPRRSVPSMYHWFSPRFSVPAAVLLLVGLSSGTAFAAQSALPGDPLYTIKIHVNESVATALATTPKAKAEVNASIATTRLEEAETLAAKGTLDATTTAALASNFAEHADAAQSNTAVVASQDPGTAAGLGATFDSTLAAHSAILSQLASDAATSSVKVSSDSLAVQVLAQAMPDIQPVVESAAATNPSDTPTEPTDVPANNVRTLSVVAPKEVSLAVQVESDASSSTAVPTQEISAPNDEVVALALQTQASSTLDGAEADFAALQESLDASTSAQVQAKLDTLQGLLLQGASSLAAGDSTAAKGSFSTVLRMSVRLDAFLKAGKKFPGSFLSSLLTSGVHRDKN